MTDALAEVTTATAPLSLVEATEGFVAKYSHVTPTKEATDATETAEVVEGAAEEAQAATEALAGTEGAKTTTGEEGAKVETVVETPNERFRLPDGTFAKTIKAKFGEGDFEVPEGLLVPLKRGDEITLKPLSEVLTEGMLRNDYNRSKEELGRDRRTLVANEAAAKAEAGELRKIVSEILANPELAITYRDDPAVAKLFADATDGRISKARETSQQTFAADDESATQEQHLRDHAARMATEFPGVEVNDVLAVYGNYLVSDQAKQDVHALSPERLRQFFTREHSRLTKVTGPMNAEMEKLRKQVADLTAAVAKNAATQKVVTRAAAPAVGAKGAAVTTGAKASPTAANGKPLSLGEATTEFLKKYI